jgi:hypothetical protein
MPTTAGQMSQTPPGDPQWRACDGSTIYRGAAIPAPFTARPATPPSTGTASDYYRNNGHWSGTLGIGGWLMRLPRDPAGTWYISTADDSGETTIANAHTPMNPPAGVT